MRRVTAVMPPSPPGAFLHRQQMACRVKDMSSATEPSCDSFHPAILKAKRVVKRTTTGTLSPDEAHCG